MRATVGAWGTLWRFDRFLKEWVGMVVWAAEQAMVWFPFFTDPEPKLR